MDYVNSKCKCKKYLNFIKPPTSISVYIKLFAISKNLVVKV